MTVDKFIKKPDGSYQKGCIECCTKRNTSYNNSKNKRLVDNSNNESIQNGVCICCTKCNKNLTVDKFTKNQDGTYQKRCIECNIKCRELLNNIISSESKDGYITCTRCTKNLSVDKFVKKRNGDYQKRCIECNEKDKKCMKLCTVESCDNHAQKSGVCVRHGYLPPRCTSETCNNKAQKSGLCRKHGAPVQKCSSDGCDNDSKAGGVCVKHGSPVIKCSVESCTHNSQKGGVCNTHGANVGKCHNCKDWIDAQYGNPKYGGYCTRCFQYLFPDDPLTLNIRRKTKEIIVRDFINATFGGFIHDKPIHMQGCDCTSRRRVDHRKLIGNTMLCIETDEYQHRSYKKNDENVRYNDLYMMHNGKWIFIRFNPDEYKVNNVKTNGELEMRLPVLKNEIERHILRIEKEKNKDFLEIHHLYYDEFEI